MSRGFESGGGAADAGQRVVGRGADAGHLDQRRILDHPGGRQIAAASLDLAPGGQLAQHGELAGREAPAPLHLAPGLTRIGRRVAAVGRAPGDLGQRPVQAAGLLEARLQLVPQRLQPAHVVARVDELRGGQRPALPVGERLVVVGRHLQRVAQQPLQAGRRRQPDEAGHHLRVADAGGARAVVQTEGEHVGGRGVHQDLDGGVGDQLGDRLERRSGERIDQHDVAVDGDLHEAQHGRVGALPEELRVDRAPAGSAGARGDLLDAGGVRDQLIHPWRRNRVARSGRDAFAHVAAADHREQRGDDLRIELVARLGAQPPLRLVAASAPPGTAGRTSSRPRCRRRTRSATAAGSGRPRGRRDSPRRPSARARSAPPRRPTAGTGCRAGSARRPRCGRGRTPTPRR